MQSAESPKKLSQEQYQSHIPQSREVGQPKQWVPMNPVPTIVLHVRQDLLQQLRHEVLGHALELINTNLDFDLDSFYTFFEAVVVQMHMYQKVKRIMDEHSDMLGLFEVHDVAMQNKMTFLHVNANVVPCTFLRAGFCYPAARVGFCKVPERSCLHSHVPRYMTEDQINEVINEFLASTPKAKHSPQSFCINHDVVDDDIVLLYHGCNWTYVEETASHCNQHVEQAGECTCVPTSLCRYCDDLREGFVGVNGDIEKDGLNVVETQNSLKRLLSEGMTHPQAPNRNWADISEELSDATEDENVFSADELNHEKWLSAMEL